MVEQATRYGIGTTVPLPYEQAVARTKEGLAEQVRARLERVLRAVSDA